jgi:hypothetical protein
VNLQQVKRLTGERKAAFVMKSRGSFSCTVQPDSHRNKGYYGALYAKPVKRLAASLGVTREVLVLVTTFTDQQARTMEAIEHHVKASGGRLESHTAMVIHEDPRAIANCETGGESAG